MVVVAPHHPWAQSPPISPSDLLANRWVLREPGSGTRSEFEAALEGFGLSAPALPVAMELPNNEAVRAAVEAGAGATAISASVAAGSIETGLLHLVEFALPDRACQVLRHRERYHSRGADALVELLRGDPATETPAA